MPARTLSAPNEQGALGLVALVTGRKIMTNSKLALVVASALLLGATSASFAQGSASFAEGVGASQSSGYSYGAPRGNGYYNYAPGHLANQHGIRRSGRTGTDAQR